MGKRVSNKSGEHVGARSGRTNRVSRQRRFVTRERRRIKDKYAAQLKQRYESKPAAPVSILERAKRLFRRRQP